MPMITVKITNTYPDRSSSRVVDIRPPRPREALQDWWDDAVLPETGDGNGGSQHAVYEAEVIASSATYSITGQKHEWEG